MTWCNIVTEVDSHNVMMEPVNQIFVGDFHEADIRIAVKYGDELNIEVTVKDVD